MWVTGPPVETTGGPALSARRQRRGRAGAGRGARCPNRGGQRAVPGRTRVCEPAAGPGPPAMPCAALPKAPDTDASHEQSSSNEWHGCAPPRCAKAAQNLNQRVVASATSGCRTAQPTHPTSSLHSKPCAPTCTPVTPPWPTASPGTPTSCATTAPGSAPDPAPWRSRATAGPGRHSQGRPRDRASAPGQVAGACPSSETPAPASFPHPPTPVAGTERPRADARRTRRFTFSLL